LATVTYILNAVNNSSRVIDQVERSLTKLQASERGAETAAANLNKMLAAQAAAAKDAADATGKLAATDEAAAAMADKLAKQQAAAASWTTRRAKAEMALAAAMAEEGTVQGGLAQLDRARIDTLEKLAEEETVAALQAELLAGALHRQGIEASREVGELSLLTMGLDEVAVAMAEDAAAADKAAAAAARYAATVEAAKAATEGGAGGGGSGRGWGFGFFGPLFRFFSSKIPLFGGLLGGVSGLHVFLDLFAEILSVVIPATLALTAFGIAASDAVKKVVVHMTNLHTVMDATFPVFHQAIAPATLALERLHKAVEPAVFEVFGDALAIVSSKSGEFGILVHGTATAVEQLAARMTVAITSGKGFSTFMRNAVPDVFKLGTVLGNLAGIFGAILRSLPELSQFFLNAAVAVTHFLEVLANATVPVIHFLLLAHGIILWAGLAVTAFLKLGPVILAAAGWLGDMLAEIVLWIVGVTAATGATGLWDAALALLADNPMVWIAAAVAVIGVMTFAIMNSRDATQKWIDTLQQGIVNAPSLVEGLHRMTAASNVFTTSLVRGREQLAALQKSPLAVTMNLHTGATAPSQAVDAQIQKNQELQRAIQQVNDQTNLYNYRVGQVAKITGSASTAQGALIASGVTMKQMLDKNAETWLIIKQQVDGVLAGYQAMGQRAGTLGNDLQVLDRTATDQYQAMQKLNQAWDQFITDVTSSQTSFDTFITGLQQIPKNAAQAAQSLTSAQAAVASAQARVNRAGAGTPGPTGLSVTAATDRLRAAQQALANVQANPAAHAAGVLASAQARVASAQNSLNNLTKGGTTNTAALTVAQQRLSAAQQRLNILQTQGKATIDGLSPASIKLNQAFTQSVVNANAMIDTWRTAGIASNLFNRGVKDSISLLVPYARGSKEATAQLVALAQEAGYQGPASMKKLVNWLGNTKDATAKVQQITDQATIQESLLTSAMDAQTKMITTKLINAIGDAEFAYYGVYQAAKTYGNQVARFGKDSQPALDAQKKLNDAIIQGGLASGKTKSQMAAMIAEVDKIPLKRAMQIVETGIGHFTIQGQGGIFGKNPSNPSNSPLIHGLPKKAAGGLVSHGSGPTSDDAVIGASRGEFVVKSASVAKYGTHMMNRINAGKFAGGGSVGANPLLQGNTGVLNGSATTQFDKAFVNKFTGSMESAMTARMKAMQQSFLNLLAVGQPGGHGAIGGGVQRWAGLVLMVLRMLGQPAGDLGTVLSQMTTESGGNPFAINLTDSNARAGDPSRGLMQTIGSTFNAYAGRFRSRGIYDPLANIYAGLNYAIHRYGSGWTSVLGHGHGYAGGGIIEEPIFGIGRSGRKYSFGEKGKETVVPGSKSGWGRGPLVHIESMTVQDETDMAMVAQRLSFAVTAASLGS
jgi:SLT domain-containing protein